MAQQLYGMGYLFYWFGSPVLAMSPPVSHPSVPHWFGEGRVKGKREGLGFVKAHFSLLIYPYTEDTASCRLQQTMVTPPPVEEE